MVSVLPHQEVGQRCGEQEQTQNSARCDKGEEISVVASADAVVQPHAVMVLRLHAGIADTAVVSTGRTPNIARLAVLDWYLHGGVGAGGQGSKGANSDPFRGRWAQS